MSVTYCLKLHIVFVFTIDINFCHVKFLMFYNMYAIQSGHRLWTIP